MEKISHTVCTTQTPSLSEWLAEFRCGIMAPKRDDKALDIMNTWTQDNKPVDWKKFVERKLVDWSK